MSVRLGRKNRKLAEGKSAGNQQSACTRLEMFDTIISDTQAKYSRTIDVLDALAVAKIDNVTFTVAEEE